LPDFDFREVETLGPRRAGWEAKVDTSSRASIMVISNSLFLRLADDCFRLCRRAQNGDDTTLKSVKSWGLLLYFHPISGGTVVILLLPVVLFKKILQKSYANDIPSIFTGEIVHPPDIFGAENRPSQRLYHLKLWHNQGQFPAAKAVGFQRKWQPITP